MPLEAAHYLAICLTNIDESGRSKIGSRSTKPPSTALATRPDAPPTSRPARPRDPWLRETIVDRSGERLAWPDEATLGESYLRRRNDDIDWW